MLSSAFTVVFFFFLNNISCSSSKDCGLNPFCFVYNATDNYFSDCIKTFTGGLN